MKPVAEVINCTDEQLCAIVLDYETAAELLWLIGNVAGYDQKCAALWTAFHINAPAVVEIFKELDEHTSREFSEDHAVTFKRTA